MRPEAATKTEARKTASISLCTSHFPLRTSVDSTPKLQTSRVRAEGANRRLPHLFRRRVEDDLEIDLGGEPRGRRDFFVQLSGAPARVAGYEARARLVRCRNHGLQHTGGGREIHAVADAYSIVVERGVADQNPAALGL